MWWCHGNHPVTLDVVGAGLILLGCTTNFLPLNKTAATHFLAVMLTQVVNGLASPVNGILVWIVNGVCVAGCTEVV